jgi:hypothetical protein
MYEYAQIIPWVGLGLLAILCLPIAALQKFVLEVYAWGLRLGLLALLGAAAYLLLRPERLPTEATDALNYFPGLRAILPEPGTRHFGVCFAGLAVAVFLPVLAALDVTRRLAGRRLRRLRALTAAPVVQMPVATAPEPRPIAAARPIDRRGAAEALAAVGPPRRGPHAGPRGH